MDSEGERKLSHSERVLIFNQAWRKGAKDTLDIVSAELAVPSPLSPSQIIENLYALWSLPRGQCAPIIKHPSDDQCPVAYENRVNMRCSKVVGHEGSHKW